VGEVRQLRRLIVRSRGQVHECAGVWHADAAAGEQAEVCGRAAIRAKYATRLRTAGHRLPSPSRGLLRTHQRGIQLGGGKEHRFLDVGRAQPFGEQRAVSCERRLELGRLRRCLRGVETIAPGAQFVDGQQRRAQDKEARRLEVAASDGCYCGHDRKGAPAERATLARRIRQDDLARGRTPDKLFALSRTIANA